MKSKPSLLIGLRQHGPKYGISESFELLISGFETYRLPFKIVDLSSNDSEKKIGGFSISKAVKILLSVFSVWTKLPSVQNVYLLVAISLLGFFRDCLIIWPAYLLKKRIILSMASVLLMISLGPLNYCTISR